MLFKSTNRHHFNLMITLTTDFEGELETCLKSDGQNG